MFLAPDGDEIELTDAVSAFLAETLPIARLHEADSADLGEAVRQVLGEMGWFGLVLPEALGGSGLSAVEHALFFREAGRQCAPVEIVAQALATLICEDAGLRAELLAGTAGVALAIREGEGLRLLGAPDAAYALLVERDAARLFDLNGAVTASRPSLSPVNSMRMLTSTPPEIFAVAGVKTWQLAELAGAAMLVGIAEAALDLIVDYAKIRETFGRKIGTYQAVRHPCADMALRAETARCQLWFAAAAIKEGRKDAGMHLDAAKHLANQAALANADSNIQLHGGIGVTDEHNAHLLLKQAMLLGKLFGSKRALLGRLIEVQVQD